MGYSFVHINKLYSYYKIGKAYEHNYRLSNVSNAISEYRNKNEELISLPVKADRQLSYLEVWQERLHALPAYAKGNRKIRKNAILALEFVTSFSRENRNQVPLEQWKEANVRWIQESFNADMEKYGDNVLSIMCHDDETGNTHCHAFIQPIDQKGHLNASFFTDGKENGRSRYSRLQDSYAEVMCSLGLQRGMKGSKARHKDIKKFYTELNQAIENVPIPQKGELATDYYERFQEQLETLSAAYLKKGLERERAADEWVTRKINDYKKQIHLEHQNQKQLLEQNLRTLSLQVIESRTHYQEAEHKIQETSAMYQQLIDNKEQELSALTNQLQEIQDLILNYENEYRTMNVADFLALLKEDTPIYQSLAAIDPESTQLLSTFQDRFQNHLQQAEPEPDQRF